MTLEKKENKTPELLRDENLNLGEIKYDRRYLE